MMSILSTLKNRIRKTNLFLILLAVFVLSAQSVLVTMLVSVDREDITIGDTFTLTFEITSKSGITFEQFDPAEHLVSFEIKDFAIKGPKKKFGKEIRIYTYQLSTFISGMYTVPSFEVPYKTAEGKGESISSPELKIEVKPVTPREGEKDDIRDIKPVLRLSVSPLFYVFITVLVIGGIAAWIFYYIRKKRRLSRIQQEFEEQRPPDVIALERLEELKRLNLIEQGQIKEFYITLSDILRHYIAKRFSIGVLDKTTFELYKDLRQHKLTKKFSTEIKGFLSECDLVKFAKYVPEHKNIDQDMNNAESIIHQTKEKEQLEIYT